MAKLLIVKGNGRGTAFDMGESATIGRSPENSLQLLDERVSKEHACIERRKDQYVLRDLQSSNGTILNGLRLTSGVSYPLKPGDVLKIGALETSVAVWDV